MEKIMSAVTTLPCVLPKHVEERYYINPHIVQQFWPRLPHIGNCIQPGKSFSLNLHINACCQNRWKFSHSLSRQFSNISDWAYCTFSIFSQKFRSEFCILVSHTDEHLNMSLLTQISCGLNLQRMSKRLSCPTICHKPPQKGHNASQQNFPLNSIWILSAKTEPIIMGVSIATSPTDCDKANEANSNGNRHYVVFHALPHSFEQFNATSSCREGDRHV